MKYGGMLKAAIKRAEEYENCFETVYDLLMKKDLFHGEPRLVFLCHYWVPFAPQQRYGAFVLHGHTHASKEARLEEEMKAKIRQNEIRCEAYNVGCMHQDYFPQTLEQIVARQERVDII